MAKSKRKNTKEEEVEIYNNIIENSTPKKNLLDSIRINIKCKSENQKKLIKSIQTKDITICSGPAGSGKTILSCAEALSIIKKDPKIKKIILVKSVTTLKEEEMGFLKGHISDKLEPVMYSFTGNFEKLIGSELYSLMKLEGLIEEKPIAYVRGVSIDNSVVIIDEIQNISIENLRTLLTRIGENSKYILLGDEKQIDLKDKTKSSLKIAMNKFEDKEDFGVVRLGKEDVVRHRLINIIEEVFDEINEELKITSEIKKDKENKKINHVSLPNLLLEEKKDNI
jgi:phosphate starvation-inducible PhoH-like protein